MHTNLRVFHRSFVSGFVSACITLASSGSCDLFFVTLSIFARVGINTEICLPGMGTAKIWRFNNPRARRKKKKEKKKKTKHAGFSEQARIRPAVTWNRRKLLPSCVPCSRAGWCACTLLALGLYLLPRYAKPLALYAWPQ